MNKLLLLHGAIGSLKQLQPLANELKRQYDVQLLNFSGHGGSSLPVQPFSISLFANDIIKWMNENAIETIDVFGYSMGGYVALYLAKHHPDKIGKIFTFATKFEWNETIAEKESKMLIPEKIEEKLPAFAQVLKERHSPADWKVVLTNTAAMMKEIGRDNPLTELDYASIKSDVMLAIGDCDKMVTLEETIAVFRKLKKPLLTVFPGTPHPIEQVDISIISDAIIKFMK